MIYQELKHVENAGQKDLQCHSQAVGQGKRGDDSAFDKICNVTHSLLVIQKDVMRLPFTNVQSHSQTVGHKKRCDEVTVIHKMYNVTHSLLVIGKDLMRLPAIKCAMSLTSYWSWGPKDLMRLP